MCSIPKRATIVSRASVQCACNPFGLVHPASVNPYFQFRCFVSQRQNKKKCPRDIEITILPIIVFSFYRSQPEDCRYLRLAKEVPNSQPTPALVDPAVLWLRGLDHHEIRFKVADGSTVLLQHET